MTKAQEELVVVCMTTTDLPAAVVPADLEQCAECGADIWFARSSPRDATKLCVACATEHRDAAIEAGERIEYVTTPKQLSEIANYFRSKLS